MSQKETFFLPDGRRTSDLKVAELKKELDKRGISKSGNKSDLLNRLNESFLSCPEVNKQIEKEKSVCIPNSKEVTDENDDAVLERGLASDGNKYPIDFGVDLDASDDNQMEQTEINQSVDALDLFVPIDDSLNVDDSSSNIRDISLVNNIEGDSRTVTISSDNEQNLPDHDKNENKSIVGISHDHIDLDNIDNIELDTQMDMYDETDNIDLNIDLTSSIDNDNSKSILGSVTSKQHSSPQPQQQSQLGFISDIDKTLLASGHLQSMSGTGNNVSIGQSDETEEGEVVSVPISARLGKRGSSSRSNNNAVGTSTSGIVPTGSVTQSSSISKTSSSGLKETRASNYSRESPERIQPAQKARHSATDTLRLDNLVRPFTLGQLKEMLVSQSMENVSTGPSDNAITDVVVDIWLNRIKSVAYARFESVTAASRVRDNVDGCRWPAISPKFLCCDFVEQREMDYMREKGDTAGGMSGTPAGNSNSGTSTFKAPISVTPPKTTTAAAPAISSGNDGSQQLTTNQTSNINHKSGHESRKRPRERERDRERDREVVPPTASGHPQPQMQPAQSDSYKRTKRSPHNHHHRRRHENSPGNAPQRDRINNRDKSKERNQPIQAPPTPPQPPIPAAKMLEDIFRKTVTQPAIYWLPVAKEKKEEVVKKVKETPVHVS